MKFNSFKKFPLTLFLSLIFSQTALSKPTIDDYAALPSTSMMRISPSGKLIAYRKQDRKQDLIVVYSLVEKRLVKAMDLAGKSPIALYFVSDTQLVMKGSKNQRIGGFRGVHDVSTAYVMDVNSGEARQLLYPGKGIYKGQLGLGSIVGLSKNGEFAFMPAFVGKSETDQNPNYSLVKASFDSRRLPNPVVKGSPFTINYFVGDNDQPLIEERLNNHLNFHEVLSWQGNEFKSIYRTEGETPKINLVAIYPNRESLVVESDSDTNGRVSYFKMTLADGTLSEEIFSRNDADVELPLTDINRTIYGVKYSGLFPSYEFLNPSTTKKMKDIAAEFPEQSVHLSDWTPDWRNLIVYVEGSNAAGDFYLVSEKNEIQFLASARPQIGIEHINPVAIYKYIAADGLPIPSVITIPRDRIDSMQNLPAIMLPHGGPRAYDNVGFDWLAQALASEGYLVIQPQFRGSTGFGVEHRDKGNGEWGRKMQSDLSDGLKSLINKKLVDPKHVCIVGASYGGYAALAAGAFTPAEYRCVVSINGVSDLPLILAQEKSQHGRYHWALSYWRTLMLGNSDAPNHLEMISPVNFAANFTSPVLLLHGSEDKVVLVEQSEKMAGALKAEKKSVKFKKLKGEDHSLSDQTTRTQTLQEIIQFVNLHI